MNDQLLLTCGELKPYTPQSGAEAYKGFPDAKMACGALPKRPPPTAQPTRCDAVDDMIALTFNFCLKTWACAREN